jgi:putative FmdB family regulatory protein
MPTYVYAHKDQNSCQLGSEFEVVQPIKDNALKKCPSCGKAIERLIFPPMSIKSPKSDSDLKGLGFTKLVKKDNGVYENVTASGSESKLFKADDPSSMPHLHKKIGD